MTVTGIAGGIGSGKSVVSRILRAMGYDVYDSDLEARRIMDESFEIKAFLVREIHPDSVDASGDIDRAVVGGVVFADHDKRMKLNAAVHSAVRDDFMKWVAERSGPSSRVFVECAILCESGLVELVDDVWEVCAPADIRVGRICARNNISSEQAIARIDAQAGEAAALAKLPHNMILNNGVSPLLPRLEQLLAGG